MRKLAIIDKNKNAHLGQWKAAPQPKKFFNNDNNLIDAIKTYNPDIIFINKGGLLNIAQAIKGYKSVYFYGDYYTPIPSYVYDFAKICNAVILTNKDKNVWQQIRWGYNQKNIHFVSQGVDTDIFKPLQNIDKKYDIIFGGNYCGPNFIGSKMRLDFVEHLLNSHYNFQVIGAGWPDHVNALPQQPHIELNRSINKSIITVGMSHFIDVPYYTSNRLYQFMATGIPHLTWYSPGVEKIFQSGYVDIKDYKDLNEKLYNFYHNFSFRKTIGALQRHEIQNYHTIYHAWQKIEKIFETI